MRKTGEVGQNLPPPSSVRVKSRSRSCLMERWRLEDNIKNITGIFPRLSHLYAAQPRFPAVGLSEIASHAHEHVSCH